MSSSKSNKTQASTSAKRSFAEVEPDQDQSSAQNKTPKVHPFFQKRTAVTVSEETGPFKWQEPLGPTGSCLHATNLEPITGVKVAALDLDGTIIKANVRNQTTDWEWWAPVVPRKIRELHESGYSLVIVSNQAIKPLPLKRWKEKVQLIAGALNVPLRLFAATAKDQYRKPMPGIWQELETIFLKDGITIDKEQSFFIGDAAGRVYSKTRSDFSSTDRKWALNVGLPFQTPEEYFLGLPPHPNVHLPGFNVSSLPELPPILPSSSALLPGNTLSEIVLFVGPPCVGKTNFYRRHFKPAGYTHVNQDMLKTRAKCVAAVLDAIDKKESCVVDNTNRDVSTRKFYLDVAKKNNVQIRCFIFTAPLELAWHNNIYRTYIEPSTDIPRRTLVPYSAIMGYRNTYEEPKAEEGFSEIRRVNWSFEGTEEEKKRWSMWLQIDGK